MFVSKDVLRDALSFAFHDRGIDVSRNAHVPINAFDLERLVTIHDHEEAFIRDTFTDSIRTAYQARVAEGRGTENVTSADVRIALMMLGAAIKAAPEQSISASNKAMLSEICPYCAVKNG